MLGRPSLGRRKLIDGIRWRVRTGAPWRDLPLQYGPWQTVYGLFRRWQRDGIWPGLLARLQARADVAGLIRWEVNVDSTVCRVRQHAAGARRRGQAQKEPPGGSRAESDDHGLGRSRGGFTAKIHLACEQGQRRLFLLVTAGQRGDSPQLVAVLEGIRVPRTGPGRPRVRPPRGAGCGVTRRIPPAPAGPICESAASGARFRSLLTRSPTASGGGRPAGGLRFEENPRT
ncbi:IS5 family transposase [Streptomyces rubradiris]